MACNSRSSCGPDFEQMRLWLKGIILELLNDGTLQAGLKDCEGEWLGKGRGVVLCDALADLLCDLINEGKLCVPKIAGFTADCDTKTLTITMADGTELTADASCFGGSGSAADGNTKIKSFTYDPQTGAVKIVDTENREFEVTISAKNTTNKAMSWEPAKQEVSVTDTDDNKVSTVVTFPVIERPPVSQGTAPTQFIGKSGELFLGEPAVWMRMLLPDGRIGRLPVFLEDQIIRKCTPYQHIYPETGDPAPLNVLADVYKTGDTLSTWASRSEKLRTAIPYIQYEPNAVPVENWKRFAEQIRDWLEQEEGPSINTGDYQVYVPVVGYVSLTELLTVDVNGVYGTLKYYHGYSSTEPMLVYAQEAAESFGIGMDGNVYELPKQACGFSREPVQEPEKSLWVSLTYVTKTNGDIDELRVSEKEILPLYSMIRYARNAGAFWEDVVEAALKLKVKLTQQHGTGWEITSGMDNSYIVSINTPFGSLVPHFIFDFDAARTDSQNQSQPYDEDAVVQQSAFIQGNAGDAATATKFFFYKTDEVTLVNNTGGSEHDRFSFDTAKKNMIQLYRQQPGSTYLVFTGQ